MCRRDRREKLVCYAQAPAEGHCAAINSNVVRTAMASWFDDGGHRYLVALQKISGVPPRRGGAAAASQGVRSDASVTRIPSLGVRIVGGCAWSCSVATRDEAGTNRGTWPPNVRYRTGLTGIPRARNGRGLGAPAAVRGSKFAARSSRLASDGSRLRGYIQAPRRDAGKQARSVTGDGVLGVENRVFHWVDPFVSWRCEAAG